MTKLWYIYNISQFSLDKGQRNAKRTSRLL